MSDSIHILFIAFILLLITILLFRECSMKKRYIESFSHDKAKKQVLLIGDDILNNIDYVYDSDETVEYNLTLYDLQVYNYAENNSKIKDIYSQFIKIHSKGKKIKNEMKKNLYIVISVGRDDLLNNNQIKNYYGKEGSANIQEVWSEYKENIERIEKEAKIKGYNTNIILIGLYLPKDKDYIKYEKIIKKWNTRLTEYSYKNNYQYINTIDTIKKENHFVDEFYISGEGSIIIAENISKSIPNK